MQHRARRQSSRETLTIWTLQDPPPPPTHTHTPSPPPKKKCTFCLLTRGDSAFSTNKTIGNLFKTCNNWKPSSISNISSRAQYCIELPIENARLLHFTSLDDISSSRALSECLELIGWSEHQSDTTVCQGRSPYFYALSLPKDLILFRTLKPDNPDLTTYCFSSYPPRIFKIVCRKFSNEVTRDFMILLCAFYH